MWISRAVDAMLRDKQSTIMALVQWRAETEAKAVRLEIENTRLRADLDWAKHRLNISEHERGMLMADRIGAPVAAPQFIPKPYDPEEALNNAPDMSTVGGDAREDEPFTPVEGLGRAMGVDYGLMPARLR